jgi:hypothetical protein
MCVLERRFEGRQVRAQLLGRKRDRFLRMRGEGPRQQTQARTDDTSDRQMQHLHPPSTANANTTLETLRQMHLLLP